MIKVEELAYSAKMICAGCNHWKSRGLGDNFIRAFSEDYGLDKKAENDVLAYITSKIPLDHLEGTCHRFPPSTSKMGSGRCAEFENKNV